MQERETDRQTDRQTLAEPTPDMTERKCFSNVLTARVCNKTGKTGNFHFFSIISLSEA